MLMVIPMIAAAGCAFFTCFWAEAWRRDTDLHYCEDVGEKANTCPATIKKAGSAELLNFALGAR